MKVDYHVHLEEGPYTSGFVQQSLQALSHFQKPAMHPGSKQGLELAAQMMQKRMQETEYSEWWLDFYLQEARNKGLKQVGIVDHLYRFYETRDYFQRYIDLESPEIGRRQAEWLDLVMVRSLDQFIDFINSQKAKWLSYGIELKLGIEADYFIGGEAELQKLLQEYAFDYVIGSVHFYEGWGFDNPELQEKFKTFDLLELYQNHFETVKSAIKSGCFDMIAHLDNVKVFNFRPEEGKLQPLYEDVAACLKANDLATEINPGLLYRYPVQEMCPSDSFLDTLVKHNVPFTMSSDSHYPHQIGIFGKQIKDMLNERGVKEVATFSNRKRIIEAL